MKLRIENIQLDTSMVLGTYDESRQGYVTLDKPRAVLNFVKQVIRDLVRPNPNHECGVGCVTPSTVILGAPFHRNLLAVAPE